MNSAKIRKLRVRLGKLKKLQVPEKLKEAVPKAERPQRRRPATVFQVTPAGLEVVGGRTLTAQVVTAIKQVGSDKQAICDYLTRAQARGAIPTTQTPERILAFHRLIALNRGWIEAQGPKSGEINQRASAVRAAASAAALERAILTAERAAITAGEILAHLEEQRADVVDGGEEDAVEEEEEDEDEKQEDAVEEDEKREDAVEEDEKREDAVEEDDDEGDEDEAGDEDEGDEEGDEEDDDEGDDDDDDEDEEDEEDDEDEEDAGEEDAGEEDEAGEDDDVLDVGDEVEYQGRGWRIVKIDEEDELLTLGRTTKKGTPQTLSLTLADLVQDNEEE